MNWLLAPVLRPGLALATGASLLLNLALLVPALFSLQVFERVFTSRSVETLLMLGALVVLALALGHAMDAVRARALATSAATLVRELHAAALARELWRRAQPQRPDPRGQRGERDTLRDLEALRAFVAGPGMVALLDAPWLPVHIVAIALLQPALGAAAALGALALIALAALGERATQRESDSAGQLARGLQRQQDVLLRQAEHVVGLGMSAGAVQACDGQLDRLLSQQQRLLRRSTRFAAASRTLRLALQSGLLGFGAWLVVAGHATPGVMIAATLLLGRALQPLAQAGSAWRAAAQAHASWQRLQEEPASTNDDAALALPAPSGRIEVQRLVHRAAPQQEPLLRGLDLALAPGEWLGLVGASGSGKTTLVRLLLGLAPPQAGSVRLDGADIASWPRERLAPHIGYLPQDALLLPGTVAENIARLAPVDPEAVLDAARRAGAHALILALPQGYDTRVGEGGCALSGGQRQRIALARALFGSPRLVVLDEPSLHLDAEGCDALAAALRALKASGATVVLVTQRSALLAHVDRVQVLHGGTLRAVQPQARAVAGLRAANA
jgi:PrtD family type I secretion system ABC transporter